MSRVDDNKFIRFIRNDMSHEEMVATEAQLLRDGEEDSIIYCTAALCHTIPDAEDLVGCEDAKIFSENARFSISEDSVTINQTKNNQAMIQLTIKDGKAVKKTTEAFYANMDESKTLEENLKIFYMQECPGTDEEEAEKVIARLKDGINTFDSALSEMIEADDFEVGKITGELLEGKTNEEKYEILLNFLVALNAFRAENLKAEDGTMIESFDEIKEHHYKADTEVTEEMIDELNGKIKEIFTSGECMLSSTEAMRALVTALPESENVKQFVADRESLYKQKLVLSTAIMIGVENGRIESLAEAEVTPEMIGAGVSSGLEQEKLLAELQNGKTPLDTALKIFKYIGAAALLVGGLYLGVLCVSSVSVLSALFLMNIFGTTTLGALLALVCTTMLVTIPMTSGFGNAMSYVVEKMGDFYDWVIAKMRGTTPEELSFTDWIKFKVENGEVVEEEEREEESEPETVFA